MTRDVHEIIRLGAGEDLAVAYDALLALLEAVEARKAMGKVLPESVAVAAIGARQAVEWCGGNRGPAAVHADAAYQAYLGRVG